jgi:hypothetical protein
VIKQSLEQFGGKMAGHVANKCDLDVILGKVFVVQWHDSPNSNISKTLAKAYTSYTIIKLCDFLLTILSRIYQYKRPKAPPLPMATLHQFIV